MAFITNQWLKDLHRVRSHTPVQTEVRWEDITEDWSRDNGIKAAFRLAKGGGIYQSVFLTNEDLTFLLPELARVADARTKNTIVRSCLGALNTKNLFAVLAELFSSKAQ